MKKSLALTLFALLGAGLMSGEQKPDRFAGIKPKIEALISQRLNPAPAPAKPANPFQVNLTGIELTNPKDPVPEKPVTPPSVLTDDDSILAFCLSKLRVSGKVLRNGVVHLLINSSTYRESDLVPVRFTGETVYYVKIVKIGESEVTLGYNEASLNIRLP